MKVLITGGMGVIGAETSRKFVKEGHRPVIFARHRDDSLIGDILDKVDFELGDVLDMPRILQSIKKHQGHAHRALPRPSSARCRPANPALSIQVNVMGSGQRAGSRARARRSARGVHVARKASTARCIGEYGVARPAKPMPEDLPAEAAAHLRQRPS